MKHIVVPMAGEGQRFRNQGYKISKPSLPLPNLLKNGQSTSMVEAALDSLCAIFSADQIHMVHRDFHVTEGVTELLENRIQNLKLYELKALTEGQAISCAKATENINPNDEILVGACDSGFMASKKKFEELKDKADAIVFVFKNYTFVEEKPEAYGWVKANQSGHVESVSVKKAISAQPINDYAICGTFWFKKAGEYNQMLKKMVKENIRINGEFYIDELLNVYLKENKKVYAFEIDSLYCWGTPADYENYIKSYNYWDEFIKNENWK